MNTLNPQFQTPAQVAQAVTRRRSGVVYSTSTPRTMGEAPVVEARLTQTEVIVAEIRTGPARTRNIRRPQVARHQPRLKAPAFDPALVSRTLNGSRA